MPIIAQCPNCQQDVSVAEVNEQGVCSLCQILFKAAPLYTEYKRLYKKFQALKSHNHPSQATERQMFRVVNRIARVCHEKLPIQGATKLVNEICEKARAEIDGFQRIETVSQARSRSSRPRHSQTSGQLEAPEPFSKNRKTESGLYLP